MVVQIGEAASRPILSPDGATIATYASDFGIQLWDVHSLTLRCTIYDPEIRRQPQFTPDGGSIVSVWHNGDTYVRNVASGAVRRVFRGFGDVSSVTVSGDLLLGYSEAGRSSRSLMVYRLSSGKLVRRLAIPRGQVFLSDDQRLLASTASANGANVVHIWDMATGRKLSTTGDTRTEVRADPSQVPGRLLDAGGPVVFSPDHKTFATGGYDPDWHEPDGSWGDAGWPIDYAARVWETRTGKLLRVMKPTEGKTRPYQPLGFSADGKVLVCGYFDADIWDARTGRKKTTVTSLSKGFPAAYAKVRTPDGGLLHKLVVDKLTNDMTLAPDGRQLLTSSLQPFRITWCDTRTGGITKSITAATHYTIASSPVFSPDGRRLAVAYSTKDKSRVCVWDTKTALPVSMAEAAEVPAGLKFGSDGKTVTVEKTAATTAEPLIAGPAERETLSPDRSLAAVTGGVSEADERGEIFTLWDVATKTKLWQRHSRENNVFLGIRFTPDGNSLIVNQSNEWENKGLLEVWNARTGEVRLGLDNSHARSCYPLSFSANGRLMAGIIGRGTVRVWNLTTGQTVSTVSSSTKYISDVVLSPDGSRLSVGSRGDVVLYSVPERKPLVRWVVMERAPGQATPDWLAVTTGGTYLASPGAEQSIRWWVGRRGYPAAAYRARFRKPEVVRQLLAQK